MTKGIRVLWSDPDDPNVIIEIEYFHGIDVDQLDEVPQFTTVPAVWPRHNGGSCVEYSVNTCIRPRPDEVHLIVSYDPANNQEIVQEWPGPFYWGTNTIILKQGARNGIGHWQIDGEDEVEEIPWIAFDRMYSPYSRLRREARFRNTILGCDNQRCVLTKETTRRSLEAAHLIPVAMDGTDMPTNGITLRADLHRLFDACLFTLNADGYVVFPNGRSALSVAYRQLFEGRRLPPDALRRVQVTLASAPFQNRCPERRSARGGP